MKKHISIVLTAVISLSPTVVFATSAQNYTEQDFVITAYYSPMPDQCCYIKGSLVDDKILNGNGTHGADGTAVYPGMIAAPKSYAFGTRIDLPGIGIGTVHDRGGAIKVHEDTGVHRLDVWAGYGEEGLARAIAFGVKRIRGKIYLPGTAAPEDNLPLEALTAPRKAIVAYRVRPDTPFDLDVKEGDTGEQVKMLQQWLKDIEYFQEPVTGKFGGVTKASIVALQKDFSIDDTAGTFGEHTAAHLQALLDQRAAKEPVAAIVEQGSAAADVLTAKRTLRFLGFYKGRTNGTYDEPMTAAVLKFQMQKGIVASKDAQGAGRIGPKTRKAIVQSYTHKRVAQRVEQIMEVRRIEHIIADASVTFTDSLKQGTKGDDVKWLQRILMGAGFLHANAASGTFDTKTKEAVVAYQLKHDIIDSAKDPLAGVVGPATCESVRRNMTQSLYRLVRGMGWQSIL